MYTGKWLNKKRINVDNSLIPAIIYTKILSNGSKRSLTIVKHLNYFTFLIPPYHTLSITVPMTHGRPAFCGAFPFLRTIPIIPRPIGPGIAILGLPIKNPENLDHPHSYPLPRKRSLRLALRLLALYALSPEV